LTASVLTTSVLFTFAAAAADFALPSVFVDVVLTASVLTTSVLIAVAGASAAKAEAEKAAAIIRAIIFFMAKSFMNC
jgi:hypothetical protein